VEGKRSYTIPILLVILTLMAILLVLAYSKLLLTQQERSIEQGRLLAEQYDHAVILANRLQEGAEALLQNGTEADRAHAAWLLGEADGVKKEALKLFAGASARAGSPSGNATDQQLQAAMDALFAESGSALTRMTEQAEPLSADQTALLQAVRDSAASMSEALGRFHQPTVDSGYRSMAAGADWVDPALSAAGTLIEMAAQLK